MDTFKDFENLLPRESFYRNSEIIKEYGSSYIHFVKNSLLVKDKRLFAEYKTGEQFIIETEEGTKSISKKLLLDILSMDGMYRYVLNNMNNEISVAVRVDLFEDGRITDSIQVSRGDLTNFFAQINERTLTFSQKMRITTFKHLTSFHVVTKKYENEIHTAVIDGEEVSINVGELLMLLSMSEDKFNQFVYGNNPYKYTKEVMLYLLNDFIKRNRILEKYNIGGKILERYRAIEEQKVIDYESINKNLKANDTDLLGNSLIEGIVINDELYQELTKYIKPVYSNLEKALHIYTRLCELLTYDQGYYAANYKDEAKTVENISNVTLDNTDITNYEFLLIYTSLLRKLGIRYTLDNKLLGGNPDEATITFRSGEYLVKVNCIGTSLNTDLTNAKINAPLEGIVCINKHETSKLKFEELFYKIVSELTETKKNSELFESSLREYHEKYAQLDLPLKDKFYVLLKDIARPNLKGMEAINYQRKVFNNLFGNDERVSINFISSTINSFKDYTYTPLTVITINESGNIKYYLIDPNNQKIVETITSSELEEYFISGEYAYLDDVEEIPGIELEKTEGVRYVR